MKNFFKGISIPQIVAGALAAVTSFLLSAKIGIAGSVIGVAAGSIVSAVSSQLYQNILKASSEKLQDVAGGSSDGSEDDAAQTDGSGTSGDEQAVSGRRVSNSAQAAGDETAVLSAGDASKAGDVTRTMAAVTTAASDETTVIGPADDATRVIGAVKPGSEVVKTSDAASGRQGRVIVSGENSGRQTANHPLAASQERARRNKRVAIIVSVVSALVAVGVTAGIIMLVTRGQGTDSVVRDMVNTTKVTPTPKLSNTGDTTDGDDKSHKRPDDEPSSTASASPSVSASSTPSPSASSSAGSTSGTGSQSGGATSGSAGSSTGSNGSSDNSGSTGTDSSNGTSGATDGDSDKTSDKNDASNSGSSSSGTTDTQSGSTASGSDSGSSSVN